MVTFYCARFKRDNLHGLEDLSLVFGIGDLRIMSRETYEDNVRKDAVCIATAQPIHPTLDPFIDAFKEWSESAGSTLLNLAIIQIIYKICCNRSVMIDDHGELFVRHYILRSLAVVVTKHDVFFDRYLWMTYPTMSAELRRLQKKQDGNIFYMDRKELFFLEGTPQEQMEHLLPWDMYLDLLIDTWWELKGLFRDMFYGVLDLLSENEANLIEFDNSETLDDHPNFMDDEEDHRMIIRFRQINDI